MGAASGPTLLRKLKLYQTKARFYLVGVSQDKRTYRLAKFSRLEGNELQASDDPVEYTEQNFKKLISTINDGNKAHGGLALVLEADALIGCFRFLEGYYLLFVTQKKLVGSICGTDKVYSIADIRLVSLKDSTNSNAIRESKDEKRYRKVLSCVELTKNFFFSYSWPLWRTLQANLSSEGPRAAWDSMFVWNNFLTRPLRMMINADLWVMPLIHGHWQQRTLAISSRIVTITIIARRSKYFAGTRYRKRGINDQGYVANDVETEQVVSAGFDWRTGFPIVSSIVQMRGSIPLFWIQDNNQRKLKPDILLQRFDPLYDATRLHFQDLSRRYGNPVVVLNLVKSIEKRPREQLLRTEYKNAVHHINQQRAEGDKVTYIPWDFNYWAKQRGSQILSHISPVIKHCLQQTSLFVSAALAPASLHAKEGSAKTVEVSRQRGVLRTNCIDCLDRTNVAQFALGLHALGLQMEALGVSDSPVLDTRSSVAVELMNLYEQMGNVLARQYGGSEAHSTIFKRQRGDWEYATAIGDKLTTLRRYYSNTYTDSEKQDALNLFLGNFIPIEGKPAIWELDSDYYLHSGLGQRFLKGLLPKFEQDSSRDTSMHGSSRSGLLTPRIICGHPVGEGVKNVAVLLAEAVEHLEQKEQSSWEGGTPSRARPDSSPTTRSGTKDQRPAPLYTSHEVPTVPEAVAGNSMHSTGVTEVGVLLQTGEESACRCFRIRAFEAVQASVRGFDQHQSEANLRDKASTSSPRISRHDLEGRANETHEAEERSMTPVMASEGRQAVKLEASPQAKETNTADQAWEAMRQFKARKLAYKQAKLESFDRMLGRPPMAVVEVKLDASLASTSSSSFLPQWLASPLGITRSRAPSADLSSLVPPALGGIDPSINLADRWERQDSGLIHQASMPPPEHSSALPLGGWPNLERRSADSGPIKLRQSGRPLMRSASETGKAWKQTVEENIQDAISHSITKSNDPHLQADGQHVYDGNRLALTEQPMALSRPRSLIPISSKEAIEGSLSKLEAMTWLEEDSSGGHQVLSQLEIPRTVRALWEGKLGEGLWLALQSDEKEAAAHYSRYIENIEKPADSVEEELNIENEYKRLCAVPALDSPCGMDSLQEPAHLRRCGIVDVATWGEAAIRKLAIEYGNALPRFCS